MRQRLLLVLCTFALITITIFAVPLSLAIAESRTQELILNRSADLRRFAALAIMYSVDGEGQALASELQAYHSTYGEHLVVLSENGHAPLNTGLDLQREDVSSALAAARRNQLPATNRMLTPFSESRLIMALPIGADSKVSGEVLMEFSTEQAKKDIRNGWGLVLIAAVAALAAFSAIALALSRWILKPLSKLNVRLEGIRDGLPQVAGTQRRAPADEEFSGPVELKLIDDTVDSMNDSLQASIAQQQRLIADTAHQLRNPLAALQFRLDVLSISPSDQIPLGVEHAQHEADRLAGLLDDLLQLARAESPECTPSRDEPHDLVALLATRAAFWAPGIAATGGELVTGLPKCGVLLTSDAGALEQIIDVLLDNARKYAPGSMVQLTLEPADGCWRIVVSDDGPGVEHAELELLTQRFYRGRAAAGQTDGSGLGLSIAQVLAQSLGADLDLGGSSASGLRVALKLHARHTERQVALEGSA